MVHHIGCAKARHILKLSKYSVHYLQVGATICNVSVLKSAIFLPLVICTTRPRDGQLLFPFNFRITNQLFHSTQVAYANDIHWALYRMHIVI